jgi:site-specific DNA recombinase
MPDRHEISSLDERFENGIVKEQRENVGSIYPENLTFDGEHYRTARLNEAVRQIYQIEKELQENKNGTSEENFDLCRKAGEGDKFRTFL